MTMTTQKLRTLREWRQRMIAALGSPTSLPAAAMLAMLALLALPGASAAHTRITQQDRAATRAYLEAKYAYERAKAADTASAAADVEALTNRLADECPGVASAAPKLGSLFEGGGGGGEPSPRERGEAGRRLRQLDDLQVELSLAVDQAQSTPYREAALAFVHTVRRLRWTDRRLTAFEHAYAAVTEWELRAAPLQVCADLRSWAASGYTALSAATRALASERDALTAPLLLAFFEQQALPSMSKFEDAHDKALGRKIEGLERAHPSLARRLLTAELRLQVELGLMKSEEIEGREKPSRSAVVIGKGRTAAGGEYKVSVVEGHTHASHHPAGCVNLEIEETSSAAGIGRFGSSSDCLSRTQPQAPTVTCDGGLLTVEAQTPPSARRVRLTLSDRREVTSPVAIVPAKLGGPIGFYYEVLRGPSPIPVRLSELGARGRLLRTVTLPRQMGCKRPPKPRNLFGHVIARGRLAQGPRFLIFARPSHFLFDRGGPFGRRIEIMAVVASDFELGPFPEARPLVVARRPRPHARPFTWRVATGCQPHEYAILYGLLRDPQDRVFVRGPDGLLPLRRARIPADLHVHGMLAYGALPSVPSEVVVRDSAGRTVLTASLSARARRAREVCEGEAEPLA